MKTVVLLLVLMTPSQDEVPLIRHYESAALCAEAEVKFKTAPYVKSVRCVPLTKLMRRGR